MITNKTQKGRPIVGATTFRVSSDPELINRVLEEKRRRFRQESEAQIIEKGDC